MSSFFLSLFFAANFLCAGSTLFLYVFLTFCLFILGMCKHNLTPHRLLLPFPFFPCILMRRERAEPSVMHTDMTICYWHRGQCKQWEHCMWQNEKAEKGSETPPLFAPSCSLTYTLAFTYKYINTYTRLCCHDSGLSLIWAWCLSHAETVH